MIILRIAALLFLVAWAVIADREYRSRGYLGFSVICGFLTALYWGVGVSVLVGLLAVVFGVVP